MSRKATKYLNSLQASLQAGKYHEVPELSRKLRKHDISKSTFARSAEVQAALLARLHRSQRDIDDANFLNVTGQFYWLELTKDETSAEIALLQQAKESIEQASPEDKEYFHVTNLFHDVATRQWTASTALSSTTNILPTSSNYTQMMTLRGIVAELEHKQVNAIVLYRESCQGSASSHRVWRSHALTRLAILDPTAANLEAYMKFHNGTRDTETARHLQVLEAYPEGEQYREHLLQSSQFPNAESTNVKLLKYVSSVVEPWILAGSDPATAEDILNLLHGAAAKTFHSPRILRYIVRTLSVLERFDEAALALDAYLQIAYHASKTQPGSDVDSALQIIQTIHYAVCNTFRDAPLSWQGHLRAAGLVSRLDKILPTIQSQDGDIRNLAAETHGVQLLLTYEASGQSDLLKPAIAHLSSAVEHSPSSQLFLELTAAHIYDNDILASMTSIHAALQLESRDTTSLLVFANLLCCEELYDRALAILSSLHTYAGLKSMTWKHRITLLRAKLMEIKVRQITEGPLVALDHTTSAFDMYSTYFGHSISDARQEITEQDSVVYNDGHITNGNTSHLPVLQTNGSLADSEKHSIGHRQRPQAVLAGQPDFLTANMHPPQEPRTIRSASVKLSHPRLHVPHLHLRKAASLRSRSRSRSSLRTPQDDSSRSSSPINHPPQPLQTASIQSIVVQDNLQANVIPDKQQTAVQLQRATADELLTDIWLYVAELSEATGTATAYLEAQQALNEAQAVSGQTPRILMAQLELKTRQLESRGSLTSQELEAIEETYESALALDIDNADTILSLSNFLLRDMLPGPDSAQDPRADEFQPPLNADHLARAYELIESIKSSPAALQPKFWRISADIAAFRGEHERAESEYWKAVELSDMQGVMKWSDLF